MQALPKLGVAMLHQPALVPLYDDEAGGVDAVAYDLDALWVDQGSGHRPRFLHNAVIMATLQAMALHRPLLPRGTGLSMGSACRFDLEWLSQVRASHARLRFPWHAERLGFRVGEWQGQPQHAGVDLPLAQDRESLDMLVPRVRQVVAAVPAPFLLRNVVHHFVFAESEMDEPDFLNQVCQRSGCGLQLDLQGLFTNAVNHAFDARAWLQAIDLQQVGEIVVAGGGLSGDWYVDSRDDAIADPVWALLEYTLPRCPNVGAVTYELDVGGLAKAGEAQVRDDLRRLQRLWDQSGVQRQPEPARQMMGTTGLEASPLRMPMESAQ